MQGNIHNALMLVAAGNAYLRGADVTGFWPHAETFKFNAICEFRAPPPSGKRGDDLPLVAADPLAWFAALKPWCKGLRLHHTHSTRGPDQQVDAPDRMLVGFVCGGPRWLIEAAGEEESDLWEGFQHLGDRNHPDRRIWLSTYILQDFTPVADSRPKDLAAGLSDLRTVLPEIEAYAREEKIDTFADCFARAREALEAPDTTVSDLAADDRRYAGFDARQVAVLQAVSHAWVFGGMGSWNDVGGSGERYDSLSERLFMALNDTIAGLANSTYRG